MTRPRSDWRQALEAVLGAMEPEVIPPAPPDRPGDRIGGAVGVARFLHAYRGVAYVTFGLVEDSRQIRGSLGRYELVMVLREDHHWAAWFLSLLAHTTFRTTLEPKETMDIAAAAPSGSSVVALLFDELCRIQVDCQPGGLLVCIGITKSELDRCLAGDAEGVVRNLKASGIYPVTEFTRT